jgi:hypothetical protein
MQSGTEAQRLLRKRCSRAQALLSRGTQATACLLPTSNIRQKARRARPHSACRRKDDSSKIESLFLHIAVLLLGAGDESFKVIVAQTSV